MFSTQYVRTVTLLHEKVKDPEAYPFSLAAVRHLHEMPLHPKVTFLVGENGSGKSTLLEAIAVAFGLNPEGGSRNFAFNTRASHSELHEYIRLVRGIIRPDDGFFLRAESYFNLGTEIEHLDREPYGGRLIISNYGGRSLHEQSHGESFMALLLNRFGGNGFYVLDEPEAALSPRRQLAVLARLKDLVSESSQFLIATHSPILMAYPDAWIYQITPKGPQRVAYEDTEHYQVTSLFLQNRDTMLRELLSPDDDT